MWARRLETTRQDTLKRRKHSRWSTSMTFDIEIESQDFHFHHKAKCGVLPRSFGEMRRRTRRKKNLTSRAAISVLPPEMCHRIPWGAARLFALQIINFGNLLRYRGSPNEWVKTVSHVKRRYFWANNRNKILGMLTFIRLIAPFYRRWTAAVFQLIQFNCASP